MPHKYSQKTQTTPSKFKKKMALNLNLIRNVS